MNPSPSRSSRLAALLAVGLALLAVALVVVVSRSRAQQKALNEQAAALQAKLESATAQASSPTAGPPATAPKGEVPDPAESPEVAPGTQIPDPSEAAAAPSQGQDDEIAAMLRSPMMQKIMASQTATIMQTAYARLMNKFELTPEERDHLLTLLVEKQTSVQNLGMQLMNPNLSAEGRAEILAQLTAAWTSGEAKIREFMNDEADYAYYQSYSQQEPERREVGMFEASLPKEDPLDPATADALATLQNDSRKKFPFTVDFYDQQNFGNPAVLNAAAVNTFLQEQSRFQAQVAEEAARLLTPAQLELYKKNQATVHQMSTMQLNTIIQLAGGGR